jgi:predicted DNA-binding transcriptional regulator AlpA
MKKTKNEREYDFALVIDGVPALTTPVEDALFEAGCDDATFSIQYGRLYGEFSRMASSLKDAILSAIRDVRKAKIGASISRVDESDLVTPSEIARRIGRTRQMVHQYISGTRGPGNFPAPEVHLTEGSPIWAWSDVSQWLAENNIIRPEEGWNAQVVATINNLLEANRLHERNPELNDEIVEKVAAALA